MTGASAAITRACTAARFWCSHCSSRDNVGFNDQPNPGIVQQILERAALFMPTLDLRAAASTAIVRVGLRPNSSAGMPLVTT